MNNTEQKKMNLKEILEMYSGIIIPDIQRDYVMGSGGKKLKSLLDAIKESEKENKKENKNFNFSCIIGHRDEENKFHIYDGQQRLATLIALCSYGNNDEEIKKLLNKFSFTKREKANEMLEDTSKINEEEIVDFSTYSLNELIKNKEEISVEYILNNIYFTIITIDKISDAEQFFLDINDGLDLKSHEMYKAELYNHIKKFEGFKEFALKMENEWLEIFRKHNKANEPEKSLVYFLQYCFRMMWIEDKGCDDEFKPSDIKFIQYSHIERIEKIIDGIKAVIENSGEFSYKEKGLIFNPRSYRYKGTHWDLTHNNYANMLKIFLENIENIEEINKDVVMWCYISASPDSSVDILNKHLRFIKKLLNNNRVKNSKGILAYNFEIPIYSRYYVDTIPKYYILNYSSEEIENYDKKEADNKSLLFCNDVIKINKEFIKNNNINIDLIDKYILQVEEGSEIKVILEKEKNKLKSSKIKEIEEYEDLPFINGLIDNLYTDDKYEEIKEDSIYKKILDKSKELDLDLEGAEVFKLLIRENIDVEKVSFKGVTLKSKNCNGTGQNLCGKVIPTNWCDLFTMDKDDRANMYEREKGEEYWIAKITENELDNLVKELKLGWIVDGEIIRYTETDPNNDKVRNSGFSPYKQKYVVVDIINFHENYKMVTKHPSAENSPWQDTEYGYNNKVKRFASIYKKYVNEQDNNEQYKEEIEKANEYIEEARKHYNQ